jgi:hypothetical protein
MSWGAQSRSKDAKTPSAARALSRNPKLALCGIQPYQLTPDSRRLSAHEQRSEMARAVAEEEAAAAQRELEKPSSNEQPIMKRK